MFQSIKQIFAKFLIAGLLLAAVANYAHAQTTTFTYQGRLTDSSMSPTGSYDFQFLVFDTAGVGTGTLIGLVSTSTGVSVTNGIFTVRVDPRVNLFANGGDRYLEVRVRPAGGGTYTILSPRQQITAAPYAIQAINATNADNAQTIGGIAASNLVQTTDSRLSDARTPTAGSANYIQNNATATPQPATNFNIAGDGRVGGTLIAVNAAVANNLDVQGNITTQGIFTGNGSGITAINGANISTGTINALRIPDLSAAKITSGTFADARLSSNIPRLDAANTFSGTQTAGIFNAATQYNIGGVRILSVSGDENIFAGRLAGFANTTGIRNAFVGTNAGNNNSTGSLNSFFGQATGLVNTTGNSNSFFGRIAGSANTTGGGNSFFGTNAGLTNTTGDFNTAVGFAADVTADNLTHATAIGAESRVSNSNTIALGRQNGADKVVVYGLGAAGSTQLCRNILNQISTCSSPLSYKTNVAPFVFGLSQIKRLRPISFDWTAGEGKDVGFGAEDVAEINPLLVNYDKNGQVEGVKYDRLSVLFVNAFQEQQAQIETQKTRIETQQKTIERQQQQLDALLKLVCAGNPSADLCRPKEDE